MLRLAAAALLTCASGLLVPATAARADGSADVSFSPSESGGGGSSVILDAENVERVREGVAGSASSKSRSTGTSECRYAGHEIDCRSSKGTWSAAKQCYVQKADPQPPFDDPIWDRRTEGTIYHCLPPGASFSAGQGVGYSFLVADADSEAAELVDPVELAERAVERMDLVAPQVGVTPLDPDAPLLVGMDAWFWIDNGGERSVGPITRSATAGPTTVTATASVVNTVWETGDGATVTCEDAGTEWTPELGPGPSPTCGHRYDRASTRERSGAFEVRATTHWRVEWSGAGQTGEITFTMTGTRPLEVTELQVLQTG